MSHRRTLLKFRTYPILGHCRDMLKTGRASRACPKAVRGPGFWGCTPCGEVRTGDSDRAGQPCSRFAVRGCSPSVSILSPTLVAIRHVRERVPPVLKTPEAARWTTCASSASSPRNGPLRCAHLRAEQASQSHSMSMFFPAAHRPVLYHFLARCIHQHPDNDSCQVHRKHGSEVAVDVLR